MQNLRAAAFRRWLARVFQRVGEVVPGLAKVLVLCGKLGLGGQVSTSRRSAFEVKGIEGVRRVKVSVDGRGVSHAGGLLREVAEVTGLAMQDRGAWLDLNGPTGRPGE